jgi:hypothetical protein
MLETRTGRRRQYDPLAAKLPTPEDRRRHFAEMGRRSAAGRVVLTTDEAAALSEAYRLLGKIAERGKLPTPPAGLGADGAT